MIPILLASQASVLGGGTPGEEMSRSVPDFDPNELMDIVRANAFNAKRFDSNPPFFWRSEVSNDRVDSYYTRMHDSTLMAFAEAATAEPKGDKRGISFQYSHDWKKLGLGKSIQGHFERTKKKSSKDGDTTSARTIVDFYTVPGLRMNDQMATDDFILAVETDLLFDVSVGFYAGAVKCGICGGEMYNGWFGIFGKDCKHFPGEEYPVLDGNGNETGEIQLCYAWIYDGRLSEVSQVYDGATPSAGHLKAELWANNNMADGQRIRSLEALYRVKLPGGSFSMLSPGLERDDMAGLKVRKNADPKDGDPTPKIEDVRDPDPTKPDPDDTVNDDDVNDGDTNENNDDDTEDERAMLEDLQSRFTPNGITLAATARGTIEFLAGEVIARNETIKGLESDAKAGKAYRKALIERGVKDGAASLGEGFDAETYRGIFDDLSIEKLETMVDGFTRMADAKYPNRRLTTEGDKPENVTPIKKPVSDHPNEAYR